MEGKYVIREGERYYWRGAMYGDDAKKATKFTFEAAKKRVERCGLEWEIVNAETLKVKLAWNFEKWTANSHIVKKTEGVCNLLSRTRLLSSREYDNKG